MWHIFNLFCSPCKSWPWWKSPEYTKALIQQRNVIAKACAAFLLSVQIVPLSSPRNLSVCVVRFKSLFARSTPLVFPFIFHSSKFLLFSVGRWCILLKQFPNNLNSSSNVSRTLSWQKRMTSSSPIYNLISLTSFLLTYSFVIPQNCTSSPASMQLQVISVTSTMLPSSPSRLWCCCRLYNDTATSFEPHSTSWCCQKSTSNDLSDNTYTIQRLVSFIEQQRFSRKQPKDAPLHVSDRNPSMSSRDSFFEKRVPESKNTPSETLKRESDTERFGSDWITFSSIFSKETRIW